MANISIKPVEPLELSFEDGLVKTALFNNRAFLIYSNEFGDINKHLKKEMEKEPYKLGGKLLYCGLKVTDPNITVEEATSILYMGGEELFSEILRLIIENFMTSVDENTKKNFQKEVKKVLLKTKKMPR